MWKNNEGLQNLIGMILMKCCVKNQVIGLLIMLIATACGNVSTTASAESANLETVIDTPVISTVTQEVEPTNTPEPSVTPKPEDIAEETIAPCNLSVLGDATVPDGTVLKPGEIFVKMWYFQNDNIRYYHSQEFNLVFDKGDQLSVSDTAPADFFPPGAEPQPILSDATWESRIFIVERDEIFSIALLMKAPDEPGIYRSYWRLEKVENDCVVDEELWAEIEVKEVIQREDADWSGVWIHSHWDSEISADISSPLALYQVGDRVNGYYYGLEMHVILIDGRVSEDGMSVSGDYGEPPGDFEYTDFKWYMLDNMKQFQGEIPLGLGVNSWCGGREGEGLPDECMHR